jgi:ABC-2 type transport system ATP-binding protein
VIEVSDLTVRFGPLVAVDGLTLSVPEGSFFGLLGPNGAGKTTALSCISAVRKPDAGRIEVAGVDAIRDPLAARSKLGIAPQALALYPTLTVAQNLSVFGGLMGLGGRRLRDRVAWGLELAQLEGRAKDVVDTLSGGMKRRLNLAAAMLHDPPVLLCDEPTTGVDAQSRNHIFDTLTRLHAEGRTIVYTTHYMEEVEALCEHVAIVDRGRVVVSDSLEGLLARAGAHRVTVELDGVVDPASVREALRAAGISATHVATSAASLEGVFLELTGRGLRDA